MTTALSKLQGAEEARIAKESRCLPAQFWIVIAAYNEEGRIGPVLDDLLRVAPNIVVVDDGSTDATTSEVLKRPVLLLRHVLNIGQGAALQTGITFALKKDAHYIATFFIAKVRNVRSRAF